MGVHQPVAADALPRALQRLLLPVGHGRAGEAVHHLGAVEQVGGELHPGVATGAIDLGRVVYLRQAPTLHLADGAACFGEHSTPQLGRIPPSLGQRDTAPTGDVALLLHLDDLNPESLVLASARVVKVVAVTAHAEGASEQVRAADREALADALARSGAHFGCETGAAEPGWKEGHPLVKAWAPIGPAADRLPPCIRTRRDWDELTWPKSTRGYFQLRSAIPHLLEAVTLTA